MATFYQFLELFATFVEGVIFLLVSINLAGKKYDSKTNSIYVFLVSVLYTAVITLMNNWQTFSFATIAVAILFTFVAMSFVTSGKTLYKLCSVMITIFFINLVDYIISYSLILIFGRSLNIADGVAMILSPGTSRTVFILVNKFLQIAVFFAFKKIYPKFKLLNTRSVTILLITVTLAFVVLSVLTSLILTSSVALLQIAIILSLFFIGITIISVITLTAVSFKYQNEKREKELLNLTNSMMEKNYTEIKHIQNTIRKQVHDFKNHLRTIDGLLPENCEAKTYISDLLDVSYRQAQNCNCGNEIIDSIINCKMNEAILHDIDFVHKIQFDKELKISPVDICAILANQIDNALEACINIPEIENRKITVEIWQKESFTFFKIMNTVKNNPFKSDGTLETSKDDKELHGYGIKNIQETANKHNGYLKNDYINGSFISLVMISSNA